MTKISTSVTEQEKLIFRSKFESLPAIIYNWCEPYCKLNGRRILDFGCGEGTTALGIALKYTPTLIVGTDINAEHNQCEHFAKEIAGISTLPENLKFAEIKRGETSEENNFDLIYSWSVFEHIDQQLLGGVIDNLFTKLSLKGLLFVQISPLYYSAEGSHLWDVGFRNWEHLTNQIDQIYHALYNSLPQLRAESLWNTFSTLNKITAAKLVEEITTRGFELLREYTTEVRIKPPKDLIAIYSEKVLITEQVVALFRKN